MLEQDLILVQVCGKFKIEDMEKFNQANIFLRTLLKEIEKKDLLHYKRLDKDINILIKNHLEDFNALLYLISEYFNQKKITPQKLAIDYLRMISDMRIEGLYFLRNKKYSCENQTMAFENVYSNTEIMSYYMNALLISQILWKHHFSIFTYFDKNLNKFFDSNYSVKALDIGPGHGFFSQIIKNRLENYNKLDIVDISESSLNMTKEIIGDEQRMNYFNMDIFDFDTSSKYDLIVLGEVIEHLDEPLKILKKISKLLTPNGILWVTTPTNAPALDHVYLFNNKDEVQDLIYSAGLNIVDSIGFYAEDVTEEIATKNRVTQLIGFFCNLSNN